MSDPHCATDGHCITCSDEGVEMTVLGTAGDIAVCRDPGGARAEVDVALVDAVRPGDVVLVHAGVALVCVIGRPDGAVPISRGRMPRGGDSS